MVTLLFSRTGDAESVQNASTLAAQLRNMGRVIIVGIGFDTFENGLADLATPGNVVPWCNLTNTDGLADQIMNMLNGGATMSTTSPHTNGPTCQMQTTTSKTPGTTSTSNVPPQTSAATSQLPQTSETTQQLTSSAAQQTTTLGDYEPEDADIVIVVDASMDSTPNLADEKALVQDLVTTRWTHFERIGLAAYATTTYSKLMDYNGLDNSYDVFMEKLDNLTINPDETGSVAKSVKRLTFNLCNKYLAL